VTNPLIPPKVGDRPHFTVLAEPRRESRYSGLLSDAKPVFVEREGLHARRSDSGIFLVMTEAQPVLFVSHAAVDMELALLLKRAVSRCFPALAIFDASDAESLKPTEDWVHSVLANLRATNLVLVIATERSMKRQWVWFEAGASWDRTSRLVTCGIGKTHKGNLPLPFAIYMAFGLTEPRDLELLFDLIEQRLGGRVAHSVNFDDLAGRFGTIEDTLIRDQKALDDPLYQERWELVNKRIDGMDANGREALKLLLLDGNSTDHFALAQLKTKGFAGNHASILPGLQVLSNLTQRVPDQPPSHQAQESYSVLWEIKPDFRPLVRRYFEERKQ
jgi:hypothetical protein